MGNPTSERIVDTPTVRGRAFTITRLTWAETDDLSFDVADKATGAPLHDESFDDEPTTLDIEELLDNVADALRDGTLGDYLSDYATDLQHVVTVTSLHDDTFPDFPTVRPAREALQAIADATWRTFENMGTEATSDDYLADIVMELIRSGAVTMSVEEFTEHSDHARTLHD